MQLDAILEVAIGLVLTWLILSMAVSQLQEFIVERLNWRSRFLENRLMDMLQSQELVAQFYQHPLIQSLFTKSMLGVERKPTNVPNDIFAQAVVDILLNPGKSGSEIPAGTMNTAGMRQSVDASMKYLEAHNKPLARTMKQLVPRMAGSTTREDPARLEKNLASFRGNAETWFDITMSQASLTYRKNAQVIALVLGFFLAWLLNIDSIYITNQLWRDPTTRQAIVAQAGNIAPDDKASLDQTMARLDELSLPIGWNAGAAPTTVSAWAMKVFGFFITAGAAGQGAPFWFDVLGRLTSLRKPQAQK